MLPTSERHTLFPGAVDNSMQDRWSEAIPISCVAQEDGFRKELNPSYALTAVDDLDEATLNARPTMSHITARLEMLKLLAAMGLDRAMTSESVDQGRDAA
jgi:hypothetical protein